VDDYDADELALSAIDAGAEDVKVENGYVEVYTAPEEMEKIRATLEQKNLDIESSELLMVPKSLIQLDEKAAMQALRLLDRLEEIEDVQNVFSNADIPDSVIESYQTAQA
jgi:transcriptional/translational regulatory protein YebC/TACO1